MELRLFLKALQENPESIKFEDTIQVIERHYHYSPAEFTNGEQHNKAGENEGSCKIFAFGQIHSLDVEQTLYCFGQHYQSVLQDPDGNSHQNIRQFVQRGWEGIVFQSKPLSAK